MKSSVFLSLFSTGNKKYMPLGVDIQLTYGETKENGQMNKQTTSPDRVCVEVTKQTMS